MRRLVLLFSISTLLISSCSNQTESKREANNEVKYEQKSDVVKVATEFDYEMKTVLAKDENCKAEPIECSHVAIAYPLFLNQNMSNANRLITNSISDMLGYGDVESAQQTDLQIIANKLIADFQSFKKEFPDTEQVWSFRLKTSIAYSDEDKISLVFASQSYTGGAHGAVNQVYFNFDKDGQLLKIEDLVSDVNSFKAIAEQKFRHKKNIKEGQSYSDAGFDFANDEFRLPANVGLTDDAFILYYNQYEIAPYSSGPTFLIIMFDELK